MNSHINSSYKEQYGEVRIISDLTDGLVSLEAISRHGQDRKTKLRNNFTGLMTSADSRLLFQLGELLAKRLPEKRAEETIVGLIKSGIIMSGFVALARQSKFNWSTPDKLGDYETAFRFSEDHRDGKQHFLYGIQPGDQVIIVDDEITSGNGVVALAQSLRDFGVEVFGIGCIVETVNFGGRRNILDHTGLELISLVQVELS